MARISEALVATAIGILVALPAIAFFNGFQRVIKTRLSRAEGFPVHGESAVARSGENG